MLDELRAIYDREQRINVEYTGVRREVLPNLIRMIDPAGAMNSIIYTDLDEVNADEAIQAQIDYFGDRPFEWKYFDYDHPGDLRDRLAAKGLTVGEAEAILVLPMDEIPEILLQPVNHDVRRIDDPDAVPHILTVQTEVFEDTIQSGDDAIAAQLADELREDPAGLSVYAAYVDGVAASSAWVRFPADNRFASLWGGATLPQYRQRGLYSSLLAVRIQEAKQRGRQFITVDASPMSRPILEKFGFHLIAYSYPCQWRGA